jgi:biotin transport system substrate-specific component
VNQKRLAAMPVLATVFASLISAAAFLPIPVPGSPVPIILQNLFLMIAALALGPLWGSAAAAIYLGLGLLGLPVFSGGTGGIARIMGPTGGFILGYLPSAAAMGLIAGKNPKKLWRFILAAACGVLIVYAAGIPWLKLSIKGSWAKAIALGFLPYIGWDVLKAAIAVPISLGLRPWLEEKLLDREE